MIISLDSCSWWGNWLEDKSNPTNMCRTGLWTVAQNKGFDIFVFTFMWCWFYFIPHCLHALTKQGVIECPIPDKDIRRFDANVRLFPPFIDNDICPLTINNTLLQSCYLRNTEWACGVAVYTGKIEINMPKVTGLGSSAFSIYTSMLQQTKLELKFM